MKSLLLLTLCLAASASYAGVMINGTTITFDDATTQNTAKPADHGGAGNTVGGTGSFIGGGTNNLVTDDFGTIGGGTDNQAGDNVAPTNVKRWATVGGGLLNIASGITSTIGGGNYNTASGVSATVGGGGGFGNGNTASGNYSTVGGGKNSMAIGKYATVGGGRSNTADGDYGTVGGGWGNFASGYASTVGGGKFSVASGDYSFVVGKFANDGGNNNSFVWGGALGLTGDPGFPRTSAGVDTFNVWSTGIYFNGSVHFSSDLDMKEAYSFVSAREVLDKVVEMPIKSWRFKGEDDSVRHIGPVAQDFMAAFGYGKNDKYITATDADGVALAAIQGLNEKLEEQRAEDAEVITALRWHNAQLQALLRSRDESFEARFARLEKAILREDES